MALLEHLGGEGKNTGITAIASHVGLHKSTCFGLLHTLQELGYVVQDKSSGRYSIGVKMFKLGQAYIDNLDLRNLANPHLHMLAAKSQETVHLVIREGLHAVYLDKVEGPHAMSIISRVGQRAHLHCTGVGKAILANLTTEDQDTILNQPMGRFTEHTLTDIEKIRDHLAGIRKTGLSIDDEEIELGLYCLAAPIFDSTGAVVAAISISGPKARLHSDKFVDLSESLRAASIAISSQMGYQK